MPVIAMMLTSSLDPRLTAGLNALLRFAEFGIGTAVYVVGVLLQPKAEVPSID
jgi:hypothetical protein